MVWALSNNSRHGRRHNTFPTQNTFPAQNTSGDRSEFQTSYPSRSAEEVQLLPVAKVDSIELNVPRSYPPHKCPRALPLRNLDVLYPQANVALELLQGALKNLELSPDERVIGHRWRALW